MQRLLGRQWGVVCEEESEASLVEFGGVGSVNSLDSELGEGFEPKEGEEETVRYPVEVNGSWLDGEGGACKYNHCGKSRSMLGEKDTRLVVGTESAVAAAATCVVAEELASVEAMRSAVVGGKEASRPIVVGGEEVSRLAPVGCGSGGWSACLNGSGDLVSTPSSAIGANSIDGARRSGWSGDIGGCEGASMVNGREDEVGRQLGSAVADGRRSLNGSENKVLNPSYSINGATRQMDGSFVSREFNRVPLVGFGGASSQPRALLDVNRESYVPLDSKHRRCRPIWI
ncbi:hypothetical protein ACSQ67_021602 [Phaseolus vulgaris]